MIVGIMHTIGGRVYLEEKDITRLPMSRTSA